MFSLPGSWGSFHSIYQNIMLYTFSVHIHIYIILFELYLNEAITKYNLKNHYLQQRKALIAISEKAFSIFTLKFELPELLPIDPSLGICEGLSGWTPNLQGSIKGTG